VAVAAEVAIPVVVAAEAVIQVAAEAVPPFTPGVVHKSAGARARSEALLPLRILPGHQQAADFTRAPRRLRISRPLRPAEEFMRAAARQFSLG
jgi:hypothetical protein